MPLQIEHYSREELKFVRVRTVGPADEAQTFPTIKANRSNEIVIFQCAPDDSGSTIFRSTGDNADNREVIKSLNKGESFGMAIVEDNRSNIYAKSELYNITHR